MIVGLAMIVGGFALGCYVGLWLCLIGGLVDIVSAVEHDTFNAGVIGYLYVVWFGFLKMFLGTILGWAIVVSFTVPGVHLFRAGAKRSVFLTTVSRFFEEGSATNG
jgi:hypothetical protein